MPGGEITPAQTSYNIDQSKLMQLAQLSKDPLATMSQIATLIPNLRKAGFGGAAAQTENPFTLFAADPTLPANIKNLANQYAASFKAGTLDPDKVDERIKQLTETAQRISQYTQTQNSLDANREQMTELRRIGQENSAEGRRLLNEIAQGNYELRKQAEANKPEQYSYPQKNDYDIVQKNKASATDAADSAEIAARAAPLLTQAYGGKVEAGFAGAIGIGSTAKDANDQLVKYGQQLALKTPKFSGPTSDADAKRYDAAVGDIANPSKSLESKTQALKDIRDLAQKSQDYARQQENYFFQNNKSLRGFEFVPSNPFGR